MTVQVRILFCRSVARPKIDNYSIQLDMRALASCAPGCGRSRRAKTRMAVGQAACWSPPGALRSSPVSSLEVRFFDPARPVAAGVIIAAVVGAAFADLAVGIDRDLPGLPGHLRDRGALLPGQLPAD